MTTTNKQAAEEFRRQVCIGNIHEIVTEEQVQQYFESYAGSGKFVRSGKINLIYNFSGKSGIP